MKKTFTVKGSQKPLEGEVIIQGHKNAAGPILCATLISEKPSIIDNIPRISDILNLIKILEQMGAQVEWINDHKIKIDPKNVNPNKMPADLFKKMRMSVLLIGPLLSRFKSFKVPHPGGDKIGLRPISAHLDAFKKLGVKFELSNGFYRFQAPKTIYGKRIVLKEFSVTATENLMMLASKCQGTTKIEIAASEPNVQDLGNFLMKMGVNIKGNGTHTLEIQGTQNFSEATHSICPDLIEAGTFFLAFVLTGGQGLIKKVDPKALTFFLEKMKEIGANFELRGNEIHIKRSENFKPAKIQSLPHPGFPTDLQPQATVLLTQAQGKSLIHDPLYENRFGHLSELKLMGADIEITDPHRALVFGKTKLTANDISATDIRAGATLILAALIADGTSRIQNVHHIERGYERFEEKLRNLGADIQIEQV
ncbi:MAG: UDP-N-acetylglucosamine 1-carboxyvinyltransferase [Patescibacteria group bacterium]|nr:UDP-N-acetylglucosamine 1-carboxyvinyltransferase [Patescibacteria group bacterium]